MNLQLVRHKEGFTADGIFGELSASDADGGQPIDVTLEHAYAQEPSDPLTWAPKIPEGVYTCRRGTHRLHDGVPFETFEILGVPDFQGKPVTGCLFHAGCFNRDSEGCVLLGSALNMSEEMITDSRKAFQKFMELQKGVDVFTLQVRNEI